MGTTRCRYSLNKSRTTNENQMDKTFFCGDGANSNVLANGGGGKRGVSQKQ